MTISGTMLCYVCYGSLIDIGKTILGTSHITFSPHTPHELSKTLLHAGPKQGAFKCISPNYAIERGPITKSYHRYYKHLVNPKPRLLHYVPGPQKTWCPMRP